MRGRIFWCALWAGTALFFAGCKEQEASPPLSSLKPEPLPQLAKANAPTARERAFQVEHAPVYGSPVPANARKVELVGEQVRIDGAPFDLLGPGAVERLEALFPEQASALLVTDAQTYLAQAAPMLALLDDARVPVFLAHPDDARLAFPVTLSDEKDFQHWLDEVRTQAPGRVRVIFRGDGYELQTVMGKLPGGDPNGPTVPRRGGSYDLARLRTALIALKGRFAQDTESFLVPSFGMELADIARSLTAWYVNPDERLFDAICLVYPRPQAR